MSQFCIYSIDWSLSGETEYIKQHNTNIVKLRTDKISKIAKNIISQGGNCCACCGNKNTQYLHIDHIIPKKGKGVQFKKLCLLLIKNKISNYNLQLLCANCNHAKRAKQKCPIDHSLD